MIHRCVEYLVTLLICERELLRVVGENAHCLDTAIDKVIDYPPLTFEVEFFVVSKHCWGYWHDAFNEVQELILSGNRVWVKSPR